MSQKESFEKSTIKKSSNSSRELINFLLEKMLLAIISIFAIIPAVYYGSTGWLQIVFIWLFVIVIAMLPVSIILKSLIQKLFPISEVKNNPPTPIIKHILQRFAVVLVMLLIMLTSSVIGMRLFGQSFLNKNCLACQIDARNYKAALWLIAAGADLNKPDNIRQTPLIYAVDRKQNWLAKILVLAGANVNPNLTRINNPLFLAVYMGNLDMVEFLLKHRADPNTTLNSTALTIALKNKRFDIAEMLLKYGADPNLRDLQGMTPLIHESKRGELQNIKFLLQYPVDVNIANNFNETALHWATINQNPEIVLSLLARGAKVDSNNPATEPKNNINEKTPLMIAASFGNKELMEILLNYGASTSYKTSQGEDVFSIVSNLNKENTELLEVLTKQKK